VTYGGDFNDGYTTGHFEINMVDKNTNSLKQLHNYVSMIAKKFKEHEEARRAEWDTMRDMPAVPDIKQEDITVPPPAGR
jgi:hypothetical protein